MKNTIIASIVAIICSAALCVTLIVGISSINDMKAMSEVPEYMTEAQAATYIGTTTDVLAMMRTKLDLVDGAFESYTYKNAAGEEVTDIVYNKTALDSVMAKLMKEQQELNFRYIQDTEK